MPQRSLNMHRATKMRVAIVYDRINKFGGAERVLQALHLIYPEAELYTSVYDPAGAEWVKSWKVHTSFLQKLWPLRKKHEWLAPLMPLAFESFDFSGYDLVISVTSEAAKGIITKPRTKHICYMLTPTRYLWSHADQYQKDFYHGFRRVLLPIHKFFMRYLKMWDRVAARRPDLIIPISNVVKKRCEQYYLQEVGSVVYPPVDTQHFSAPTDFRLPFNAYYLCVARLVPYKRIDLAIHACKALQRHLVIVGIGSEEEKLRTLADHSPCIHFLGHLTEHELVGYYQQCRGFLFPGEEDFGLTVVEAMAAGKPVVTYAKSGNAEIVEEGKTGILMKHQTVKDLTQAMIALEARTWNTDYLRCRAAVYDTERFIENWRKAI